MTAGTDTHLLLRALCDELARCGTEHACTSPGSRNSPIVVALAADPRIRSWSHIDERCAGFFALGLAKATGRPVAVTCTSGTAAANLMPAVIEAWQARLPLIVLTADRPAELRDVGAGQAIDQLKLFGHAVKWFVEVEAPDASPASLRWIRQLACRAYWTATEGRPGPVHLNLPLREPLVADGPLPADPLGGRAQGRPWVGGGRHPAAGPAPRAPLPPRGVIVAGRLERRPDDRDVVAATIGLAERTGWPLLADPLSGCRDHPAAIGGYDLVLRDPAVARRLVPEVVVRVGDLPTSKPLRAWLASLGDVPQLAIDPDSAWQDPDAVVSERETGDPVTALASLEAAPAADAGWQRGWREADTAVTAAVGAELGDALSEPLIAARLGEWLGPEDTVFCAASMPIRDLETYLPAGRPLPRVLANRGANGIDGTVSSAFGVAAAAEGPVVLLIGDVALAHDIGGLLAAKRLGLELTIVLINNDGGGIFHFLPISGAGAPFDWDVVTPHGLAFAHAATLYELGYERPGSAAELRDALQRAIGSGQTTIIEVRTEREANLDLHRRLAAAAAGALAG
jgi:2-succinyl-5-enolpyruvyl-6-hydroxy-3-cyclohexene-1-carboxylate synthase